MDLTWLWTALAGASVPTIGWVGQWVIKKTPESKSPVEVASLTLTSISAELDKVSARLEAERTANAEYRGKVDAQIQDLKHDIEKYWHHTVILKRHVISLEDTLTDHDFPVPERPSEVQELFA